MSSRMPSWVVTVYGVNGTNLRLASHRFTSLGLEQDRSAMPAEETLAGTGAPSTKPTLRMPVEPPRATYMTSSSSITAKCGADPLQVGLHRARNPGGVEVGPTEP